MDSSESYTDFPAIKVIQNEVKLEKGDINGDKAVNSIDASEVLTEYASVSSGRGSRFSASQVTAAVLSGNGDVDAVDASMILGIYAKNATK